MIHYIKPPSDRPKRYRRPSKPHPVSLFILSKIPTYPGMIGIEAIRHHLMQHPDYRYETASQPVALCSRMAVFVKRYKVIRIGKGLFAKPRNAQDLGIKWRPVKHSKPTMSQQLRTANAALREQLGAEPKKRNHTRNLFAPRVVEKPVLSDEFIDMRPEGCLEYPDFAYENDIFA